MFAIKVWLTKNESDWFYMRDPKDQVVQTWGRKEKAEIVLKALTCFKAELEENLSSSIVIRVNKKKQGDKII
jgi:hypothetical protein